jgi:hypothetical protein
MNRHIALALVLMSGLDLVADENDWLVPLGPPPQAAPRRISGGEAVPPLPLPATPLRRSERKREPSPPNLCTKVIWGDSSEYKFDNGLTTQVADWNQCPADIQQILRKSNEAMGARYGADTVSLSTFHWDPTKSGILFFSGSRTIKFTDAQIEQLRTYVLRGGMVIADNIAGSPYFYAAFKKGMEQAFPENPWREVPLDHPVYHMMADVAKVKFPKNHDADRPLIEGMYFFSRVGVVISKYGLGCGWDDREVPFLSQAVYYDAVSASKIGVNLMAYAVGYANVARESAKPELFGALDEKHPTDEFLFAQIKHEGHWNVHAGGAAALLRQMRQNTSIKVSLKRFPVVPGKDDLSPYGFLYLTGLDDFHFGDAAVAALRQFLNRGGTLLINNGLGLQTFEQAAKRELRRILPEAELKPLALSHPLYSTVFKIGEVKYTPAVQRLMPELKAPLLEGVSIGGDLKVIYSPFDLEMGWQGMEHPLAKGYEPESAAQVGLNIVMYTMTH